MRFKSDQEEILQLEGGDASTQLLRKAVDVGQVRLDEVLGSLMWWVAGSLGLSL